MFDGVHNKHLIEKVYLQNGRNMEFTLDLFLTGNVPKEEDELQVTIQEKEETKVEVTPTLIQQNKKKLDLKQYVLQEYSGILGKGEVDTQKMKGNKFY
jgi:hypothetical protein